MPTKVVSESAYQGFRELCANTLSSANSPRMIARDIRSASLVDDAVCPELVEEGLTA
jgi:hypothetical protein